MKSLQRFGISEAELLLSCDTTFKQGIKFVNWLDANQHDQNFYYHSFDEPYPGGLDISAYWVNHPNDQPFDNVGIQARICELGLAPKKISSGEYTGKLSYAYHFDAAKFAKLLARNCQKKFNIKHLFATIVSANKDEKGNITHLVTDENKELAFDFYVDCSGFNSILIDKELNVPFISKADELFTDTVLVQQIPLSTDEAINPYTTATAHKAGWIWDIPLTSRRGTGFVYSSRHMSDEEAVKSYADYLGIGSDPSNSDASFSPRKLKMNIGFREKFWQNNCVALGLAQGFLEPLEATSILLTDFSAELLARNFPKDSSELDTFQSYYNKTVAYTWERTVDFIKLHYCISDRTDSEFWVENQSNTHFSEELKERLNKFTLRPPHQSDFFSRFDLFDHKNFLYVLYGMQYKTKMQNLTTHEISSAQAILESNEKIVSLASQQLLHHREWLMKLKAAAQQS
jgi:tryptophan halogenase